ncbi:hypothetical protein MAPG_01948 [Magnaporthiopsis poae ATCC 64411]|uniref:Uncharacterized protein n=1 Tax=Magnaporthiopsis poae (strain ATCC 64411 / 73-15) TaxID=644358 RepID=A0A0C4DQ14_MAGP6|nr:hypothetical protein MAPG_01948 [Magnaporthiopsis poae ATCC 64411]
MVSFFGLGKKKKAEPPKQAPLPTTRKKVDQNTFGEGQYFGNNVKSKPVLSPGMHDFPSRPGTSSSMRNSPYAMQTHNFAATSMRDLSNMPGTSWTIEAPGTGLKSSASDVNLGMRWANSSSTSLAAPSTGLRPGTSAGRPTTPAGDRKNKPWVNPLDVHFGRAVPPAPKSPLGNFELQVDVDGTGSLMGDDDIESTTSKAGAAASASTLASPITTNFGFRSPPGVGLPMSPLGPPSSPPTGSLPSPPRSVNGAGDKFDSGRNLRPQHKGFGPAALPSPALSQRGGSQDSAPITNSDNDMDSHDHHDDNHDNHTLAGDSDVWDESDAFDLSKPVIRDVAAKRDTLTISGARRQSLSMKIEELEKSLVSAQQESEQKNKAAAAAAAGAARPQGDDPRLRSGSTATAPMRNNGVNWQAAVWGVSVGAGSSLSPMHPDDRKPSPSFADNRGPRPQSPLRQGPLPNAGLSGGPVGRNMPLGDYDARAQSPQIRNEQRPIPPFAGPGSRAQSPMGRIPAQPPRAESPMDRDRFGAESPVDRPPPRPYAQEPPPRSPMRAVAPAGGLMGGGPSPVFPKRGNGPNSSNPNGYWGPKDKSLTGVAASAEVNAFRAESPPAVDLSRQQSAQSSTGRSSPMLNAPGPIVRGPNTPRRPAPEEYGVFPSNSDRSLNRGPPRAAVGAMRGEIPSPGSSRRTPSDESESMQALHPPPRPQQQQLRPGHAQEQPWGSNPEGGTRHNDFAAPLASPLLPNKDNVFGGGGVSAPTTPAMMDNPNWPLPAPTLNVQTVPQRPRTAGGPGHEGGNNALGIGLATTSSVRKPQRHHVPPPLNLFSAQQYAEEIPSGPFTPSPTVPPLTPTRSLTTPMAACDDPRPKTAGAGSGTIGMARGLSLRYERERQGFKDGNAAWSGQGPRGPLPDIPAAAQRRPDHGLEAPTGIADRFGNRFI